MTSFVFNDDDLQFYLFGLAPLTNHGLSATYTSDDLLTTTPAPDDPKTILSSTASKNLATTSGVSHYPRLASLPPTTSYDTNNIRFPGL